MIMKRQLIPEVIGHSAAAAPKPRAHAHGMAARGWCQVIETWIQRSRQRRALAKLDDWLLRDAGISRTEASREIAKPFWR